mmetsp:Transcript_748/g.2863  ORF Transcript_748/g.2863 Transcript_748/m.2863 type:complete len:205 (-) Transcript_748:1027-1641(-)
MLFMVADCAPHAAGQSDRAHRLLPDAPPSKSSALMPRPPAPPAHTMALRACSRMSALPKTKRRATASPPWGTASGRLPGSTTIRSKETASSWASCLVSPSLPAPPASAAFCRLAPPRRRFLGRHSTKRIASSAAAAPSDEAALAWASDNARPQESSVLPTLQTSISLTSDGSDRSKKCALQWRKCSKLQRPWFRVLCSTCCRQP